jgi:myo-inositol-1(or 4)-monophosphatase
MLNPVIKIAEKAGTLLRDHFGTTLKVNAAELHDMKLQIDIDTQRLIEAELRKVFPKHAIIGEEESYGDPNSEFRWVVDPLDGTVNYSYGIPHFGISMGLQKKNPDTKHSEALLGYETVLAVIYDPMRNELFSAEKDQGAFLNGHRICVSSRSGLGDSIISIGFAKSDETIVRGLENYQRLIRRVRKIRTMGSAALDLAYVAAGRMEAYYEFQVRLWDIAAGMLIVEEAGGVVDIKPVMNQPHTFQTYARNGKVDLGVE